MSIKLQGNGLWESSRMMLPQHKESIIEHQKQYNKKSRPSIHQDELEVINQNINHSLHYKETIQVKVFNEYQDLIICGVVTAISQFNKNFRVQNEQGFEWIDFDEIVSVRFM
ncbi:YolD-like family protein [Paenibacillus sp. FSL W7-1287]|uniref:YolD-like family protein n=1 Tax=Paenibacillus sp. FSL W7-1287 TaxID=2954538 RepID=UPI0030FC13DD